jgi:hypothetical protein
VAESVTGLSVNPGSGSFIGDLQDLFSNAAPPSLGGQVMTPGELSGQLQAAYSANTVAATNPVTGVVNQDLLNQANTQATAEITGVQQQAQASANAADPVYTFFSNLMGGDSSFPWGTILLLAALGVGGYIVVKIVEK